MEGVEEMGEGAGILMITGTAAKGKRGVAICLEISTSSIILLF